MAQRNTKVIMAVTAAILSILTMASLTAEPSEASSCSWVSETAGAGGMVAEYDDGDTEIHIILDVDPQIAVYKVLVNGREYSASDRSAVINLGYALDHDMDYLIVVTGDGISAACRLAYREFVDISAVADVPEGGTVTGADSYQVGTQVTLTAAPAQGYRFAGWEYEGGIVSAVESYTFTAMADATYTARFVKQATVTVSVDGVGGTVTGSATVDVGSVITITAVPEEKYLFKSWNDGSTDAVRSVTVTEDAEYIATFELDTTKECLIKFRFADLEIPVRVNAGDVIIAPERPAARVSEGTGYVFLKWTGFTEGTVADRDCEYLALAATVSGGDAKKASVPLGQCSGILDKVVTDEILAFGPGSVEFDFSDARVVMTSDAFTRIFTDDSVMIAGYIGDGDLTEKQREARGDGSVIRVKITVGGQTVSEFGEQVSVVVKYSLRPGYEAEGISLKYFPEDGVAGDSLDRHYSYDRKELSFSVDGSADMILTASAVHIKADIALPALAVASLALIGSIGAVALVKKYRS